MQNTAQQRTNPLWQQVLNRDPNATFVYAVTTTGVFCRPTCPSRRPAEHNVTFFPSPAGALGAGFRACKRCAPLGSHPEASIVLRLCRHLARHRDQTITLTELGKLGQMSPFTVQRTFERILGISPREFQAQLRANALRHGLASQANVTDAIYQAGYSSSSRFYERAAEKLGMSPTRFRNGGRGETIRFAIAVCPLGLVLVAATGRGLCSVILGDHRTALEEELHSRFQEATVVADQSAMEDHLSGIVSRMTHHPAANDLPLDIRATSFQARVWGALRQIPRGETRSYAELAREMGQPSAVRAVARACASNPVAIAIPCHRVIGSDGALTGYRWGVERKRKLLGVERGS